MSHPTEVRNGFPEDVQTAAEKLEHARASNYQIPPLSKTMPNLDQRQGYQIAASLRRLREDVNGQVVAGRKIGFTNRNIWPEYNIDASNWSYMYQDTIVDLAKHQQDANTGGAVEIDITHLSNLEPRIEPEIVLKLSRPITSSMDDLTLLQSVEWISHGFEIVASVYPDWKFTAPDTTAAFALHGLLLVGRQVPVTRNATADMPKLLKDLESFTIDLVQNESIVDSGKGSNVLGSPIKALRHLAELLEQDIYNAQLTAGEIITTGTLTKALPITHNDVWSTKLSGTDLDGLHVKFRLQ